MTFQTESITYIASIWVSLKRMTHPLNLQITLLLYRRTDPLFSKVGFIMRIYFSFFFLVRSKIVTIGLQDANSPFQTSVLKLFSIEMSNYSNMIQFCECYGRVSQPESGAESFLFIYSTFLTHKFCLLSSQIIFEQNTIHSPSQKTENRHELYSQTFPFNSHHFHIILFKIFSLTHAGKVS